MEPVITPLNQPLTSFPHFMPNQVLTHTQLNELAVYLEQQDRFSRQRLIGIGIVCGLQAKLEQAGNVYTVYVSKGVGVSSCGFLLDVPATISFTKKKSYTTPVDYTPFLLGAADTPITCIELKEDASTESGISNLNSQDVDDKVVVLFLDIDDKPNGKCIGENCDEKGNKWVFKLRVLLVDRAGASINSLHTINRTLKESYEPNPFNNPLSTDTERQNFFNPPFALPTIFSERFGNVNGSNPNADFILADIESLADFEKAYSIIIESSAIRVANALFKAYELFKPFFDVQLSITTNPFGGFDITNNSNALAKKLVGLVLQGNPSYIKGSCQYVFDFIGDLSDTYNELRQELFDLSSECSPDPTKFPRHLYLGVLDKNVSFGKFTPSFYEPPSVYRHHFLYSPIMNHQSEHLKRVKMLIQRIRLLLDNLNFSGILQSSIKEEPIRITPDKYCCEPLGQQRIPFYYNKEGAIKLHKFWDFRHTIQNRSFENRSYWAKEFIPNTIPNTLQDRLLSPLLYDICNYPKLSIEGHVGKNLEQTIENLKQFRKQYNLSFDILALKLDDSFDNVYLAEDNLIADIQTLYLSNRNEYVCCLQELVDYTSTNKLEIAIFLSLTLVVVSNNPQAIIANLAVIQFILLQIVEAYITMTEDMIQALPPDIKLFDIHKLANAYPSFSGLTSIFKYGINTWGDIEFFLLDDKPGKGIGSQNFNGLLSDLISVVLNIWELHLDKVNDDCILGKFYTIYAHYIERLQTFTMFNKFNEKVHGMEHIAGTSKGGCFILIYSDEDDKIFFNGQVLDENGKPIKSAILKDENTGSIYGKTNNKGYYKVMVSKSVKKLQLLKSGYVTNSIDVKEGNVKPMAMRSYESMASANKVNESKLAVTDLAFIKIKKSLNALKKMDKGYAKWISYLKFKPVATDAFSAVSLDNKENFRVVADFYLPHLIHNYKTEAVVFDACSTLKETKMIDYAAMTKVAGKSIVTSKGLSALKGFKNIYADK